MLDKRTKGNYNITIGNKTTWKGSEHMPNAIKLETLIQRSPFSELYIY